MSSDTSRWTDDKVQEAARIAITHDAHVYAVAYRTANIVVPFDCNGNQSLIRALQEVAMQAAAVALLIEQRGDDD